MTITRAEAIEHVEDLVNVCAKQAEEIATLREQKQRLFKALRDMTEWWAYAVERPAGAQPDALDEIRVEQLAASAADALFNADPDYVVKRPSEGHIREDNHNDLHDRK